MRYQSKNLLTLFIASSVTGLMVIWITIYFGTRYVYQQHVVDIAQQQSVSIGEALIAQESALLVDGDFDIATTLAIRPETFDIIDRRMHDYLKPFGIVKIKVFDTSAKIIYSTDPNIVGMLDKDNPGLKSALEGSVNAVLETEDKFVDMSEEELLDIDVVETYVPIRNLRGGVIGSLEVYTDVTRHRERLKDILIASMSLVAVILVATFGALFFIMRRGTEQLTDYEHKLHALAVTDELTGISNRRFLLSRAEEEFARAQRERKQIHRAVNVGCILADVDHFKKVNDAYGHQIGDAILQELAARMKHVVRRYDVVGRYGGEEFLVLMPYAEGGQVKEVAERLRLDICRRPFQVDDLQLNVTISIGYAWIGEEDVGIDDVIKRADDALYQAKANGRDQISTLEDCEEAAKSA